MTDTMISVIANTVPQFIFAIVLFYLCQQNTDKQREAYQGQIVELYAMIGKMLEAVNRSISIIENKDM